MMVIQSSWILPALVVAAALCRTEAFYVVSPPRQPAAAPGSSISRTARPSRRTRAFVIRNLEPLLATTSSSKTEARRKELLTRKGPHFKLDRVTGDIEFGATAYLVTQLTDDDDGTSSTPDEDAESIATWLRDGRGLALSIWDEDLLTDLGDNVYRLQIMTLQFVTIQLAPWVDVEMKTMTSAQDHQTPVFSLQSIRFEPNLQVLPGLTVSAESLGIVIEVSGQLRPSANGKGVSGAIAFQTSGNLPLPLRILPDAILKQSSDAINDRVANFAIQSFQKGAKNKYREYMRKQREQGIETPVQS